MIAELGLFALILGLCLAIAQSVLPLLGSFRSNAVWMRSGLSLAIGQFGLMLISFVCLTLNFIQDDFSVAYVAANSNTLLPMHYKISAVWGAHEGSLLLWALILSGWGAAVAIFSRQLPLPLLARVLAVIGFIGVGFDLFLLLTSNPFLRNLPFSPTEGGDLNPLLQDFGLIVHPPMLYMGYVGFSVAFAFAIAALIDGKMDAAWARWARPWTNIAWVFLTLGITLGSWWAYYELGWGGWWFWDPVENASFMPWLVGTALVHSLSVAEKRGNFKVWTLLLAILAFSLSLLGTFLVRSGVLTSVHAFASDPERGIFILVFLLIVIGGSLLLFALRGAGFRNNSAFTGLSRELFLLINNGVLTVTMVMILVGTLFPLLADVLELGKYSVGPPFFNIFFVPLMAILVLAMGAGGISLWKKSQPTRQRTEALYSAAYGAVLTALFFLVSIHPFKLGAAISLWLALVLVVYLLRDALYKARNAESVWRGLSKLPRDYWGMVLAHLGVAVAVVGVGLSVSYDQQKDLRMDVGDSHAMASYRFQFNGVREVAGPNYSAFQGEIAIYSGDKLVDTMHPEKRNYLARGNVMTEAGIDAGLWRDLYVSLGEPLSSEGHEGAWSLRLHVKPFVRWIWLGGILMSLGALLAAMDKRYRAKQKRMTQATPEVTA